MAKRTKKEKQNAPDKENEATPELTETKDTEPTVESTGYAAMPDEITDPGNTFKMALLDAQKAALQNKRQFTELNYNVMISNTQKKMSLELATLDAEIKSLERRYKDQKDYIEETHKIALKSYNYDDETGILTKMEQEL